MSATQVRLRERFLPLLFSGRRSHSLLRRRVLCLLFVLAVVDLLATVVLHRVDGVRSTEAFEWTTSQLVTAGSSQDPRKPFSQAEEIVLGAIAVTVVAALAGSLAAYFHRRELEDEEDERSRPEVPSP